MAVVMRNSSPVAEGQTIAEKYRVERVLGEGGMGMVVAAWHLGLQQRVAIKFLLKQIAHDHEGAAERFRREARAAARIRSEHVCRVLDVGTLEDGIPFMVMEYLDGCDLSEELMRRGRLGVSEAVQSVLQACEALAEAHMAGIVHRDLKPANLFLAQRPDGSRAIKVLDFGVSKSLTEAGISHLTLTKTATLIGSPIYMSPEQLESSKDVDARTDIWALGAILYELLTGRTPFSGDSIPQLVNAVLHSDPMPFARLDVQAPPELEQVVLRALTKQRELRFTTVGELTEALAPFAPAQAAVSVTRIARVLAPGSRDDAEPAPGGAADAGAADAGPSGRAASGERARDQPAQRGRLWLISALVLAGLGGGLVWAAVRGRRSEPAKPPAGAPSLGVAGQDKQDAGLAGSMAAEPAAQPASQAAAAPAAKPVPDAGSSAQARPEAPPKDSSASAAEQLPRGVDLSRQLPSAVHARPERPEPSSRRHGNVEEHAVPISDFGGRR